MWWLRYRPLKRPSSIDLEGRFRPSARPENPGGKPKLLLSHSYSLVSSVELSSYPERGTLNSNVDSKQFIFANGWSWPQILSLPDQSPPTPKPRLCRNPQINDSFLTAHLWWYLLFSTPLNLFKGSTCLPNLRDNRDVTSDLHVRLLMTIGEAISRPGTFALNTVSMIPSCYWWDSSAGLPPRSTVFWGGGYVSGI